VHAQLNNLIVVAAKSAVLAELAQAPIGAATPVATVPVVPAIPA
jgi:hypothetical protein